MKNKIAFTCLFIAFGLVFMSPIHAQQAVVNISQDKDIPKLLELKAEMTKNNELVDRYRIQILGYGQSLSEANGILGKYKSQGGQWPASIHYGNPNYKVWVGHFRDRLDADRALIEVKKDFPDAFVFKPKE